MDFFKYYSQDNCLLECRIKKVTQACGCSPWYIRQDNLDVLADLAGLRPANLLAPNRCFSLMFVKTLMHPKGEIFLTARFF